MDFYKRVGLVCRAIPKGRASTYGQIALLCGMPNHSRQVGFALNRGLSGDVPAHRVVNHQGYLTGALSFDTPDLQRILLEAEGVECYEDKPGRFRVDLKRFGWKNTMEEAAELQKKFAESGI
ncbi:MAG: MGMT family protein [Lachnospiraceae bacterium]|jgi:methylated-DNA-protein-cysteine methyltransferase-like protein|nr:MGMT family protein [Lachnospiraceae bacterium]MDE6929422.1 MGMT family protein [Lachnospiraceae bacterium]